MKTLLGLLVCCLAACGAPSVTGNLDTDAGSADGAIARDAARVDARPLPTCSLLPHQCLDEYAPDGGALLFARDCVCPTSMMCSHDPLHYALCVTP
jgi:hypothetical protein